MRSAEWPTVEFKRRSDVRICGALRLAGMFCCFASVFSWGQAMSSAYSSIPQDPGYLLYFHDADNAPNLADRWGYHDGWMDGRRSRNLGVTDVVLEEQPKYAAPPEHDRPAGLTRTQYIREYRAAYLHGYAQGTR
jgi:hypothetical protein